MSFVWHGRICQSSALSHQKCCQAAQNEARSHCDAVPREARDSQHSVHLQALLPRLPSCPHNSFKSRSRHALRNPDIQKGATWCNPWNALSHPMLHLFLLLSWCHHLFFFSGECGEPPSDPPRKVMMINAKPSRRTDSTPIQAPRAATASALSRLANAQSNIRQISRL